MLGTSLKVEPFNKLIAQVSPKCPRLLINREKAGQELHSGFDFEDKWRYTIQRDALFLGNCDEGVRALADLCGWEVTIQTAFLSWACLRPVNFTIDMELILTVELCNYCIV